MQRRRLYIYKHKPNTLEKVLFIGLKRHLKCQTFWILVEEIPREMRPGCLKCVDISVPDAISQNNKVI